MRPTDAAFLFDLDGTLADTLPDIAATADHVRLVHGLAPLGPDAARAWIGDGARTLVERALAEALPTAPDARRAAVDRAFAVYVEHHEAQCTRLCHLFPGVEPFLDALRERGHPLAIVTNKPERFAFPVVRHLGLDRWFDVVVGGDSAGRKKPDPAPLRLALERLGSEPTAATMVGDGVQDVRAGLAIGAFTTACLFGYGDPERLRAAGPHRCWIAFGEALPPAER